MLGGWELAMLTRLACEEGGPAGAGWGGANEGGDSSQATRLSHGQCHLLESVDFGPLGCKRRWRC